LEAPVVYLEAPCLLGSALFTWKRQSSPIWMEIGWKLAVLFSRQILNGSQDFFFLFNILIFDYFFKYVTIETHARAFLALIILGIGRVTLRIGEVASYQKLGIILENKVIDVIKK
jgi:hypothetical protein